MSDEIAKRILNEAAATRVPQTEDWVWKLMQDYVIPCAQVGERWAVQIIRTGQLFM